MPRDGVGVIDRNAVSGRIEQCAGGGWERGSELWRERSSCDSRRGASGRDCVCVTGGVVRRGRVVVGSGRRTEQRGDDGGGSRVDCDAGRRQRDELVVAGIGSDRRERVCRDRVAIDIVCTVQERERGRDRSEHCGELSGWSDVWV